MTEEQERALIDEMIALLANFPADGKPSNSDAAQYAIMLGLIERHEINKPCRGCGTPRLDHSYFRVSAAGKALLAFPQREAQP